VVPPPSLGQKRPSTDRRRRWRVARWAGALAVAGALVAVAVLYWPDVAAALRALRTPDPRWLIAAILLQTVSMGLYARMQRRLLRGAGTTVALRRVVSLTYAAHSMSITLPGGPLVSTVYNYRRMRAFGADSTVAAWCTAASGVLSSLGLVVFSVAVGVVAATDDAGDALTLLAVIAGGVLVAGGLALVRRRPGWQAALSRWFGAVLARMPRAHRRRLDGAIAWAARLLQVRIPPRDLAMASGQSVGNWVADAACLGACCLALGVSVDPIALALTYLAAMTVSGLPVVPGGLGTVDGALTAGLVAAGVKASPALAVDVLYRLITFVLIGGIGWLLWLVSRYRRRRTAPATGAR
jgi:putative heme transporter